MEGRGALEVLDHLARLASPPVQVLDEEMMSSTTFLDFLPELTTLFYVTDYD